MFNKKTWLLLATVVAAGTFIFVWKRHKKHRNAEKLEENDREIPVEPDCSDNSTNTIENAKNSFDSFKTDVKNTVDYDGYFNNAGQESSDKKTEQEPDEKKKPYIISGDEFGTLEDYNAISFILCSDNIIIDMNFENVNDIESILGFDPLERMPDNDSYEDLYVRDDVLRMDYEIFRDIRTAKKIKEDNGVKI